MRGKVRVRIALGLTARHEVHLVHDQAVLSKSRQLLLLALTLLRDTSEGHLSRGRRSPTCHTWLRQPLIPLQLQPSLLLNCIFLVRQIDINNFLFLRSFMALVHRNTVLAANLFLGRSI